MNRIRNRAASDKFEIVTQFCQGSGVKAEFAGFHRTQVVASSGNLYSINKSQPKRQVALSSFLL